MTCGSGYQHRVAACLAVLLVASFGTVDGAFIDAFWQGGDVVGTGGGDGRVVLEQGVSKTAMLRVQTDERRGYTVALTCTNATGRTSSELLWQNVGGGADKTLEYTLALDVSALSGITRRVNPNLRVNNTRKSLTVVIGNGNPLPDTPATAHEIGLLMTLQSFNPISKVAGDYGDVVTAVVTMR